MSRRTAYTEISPLPANISRQTVIDFLHDHVGMIDLNPLVRDRHPIPTPHYAPPDERHCAWYSLTDKISYLPGGIATGDVSYTAAFTDLPNGLQTHCRAPLGVEICSRWTVNGSLPGEPTEHAEPGLAAPSTGLYIREDVELRCNVMVSSFVKKTTKKAHQTLVQHLASKAQAEANYGDTFGSQPLRASATLAPLPAFVAYTRPAPAAPPSQDGIRGHGYSLSDGCVRPAAPEPKDASPAVAELPAPLSSSLAYQQRFMSPAAPRPHRFSDVPQQSSTAPLPYRPYFPTKDLAPQDPLSSTSFTSPRQPPPVPEDPQRHSLASPADRGYLAYSPTPPRPAAPPPTIAVRMPFYPPSPSTASSAGSDDDCYLMAGPVTDVPPLNPLCIQRPPHRNSHHGGRFTLRDDGPLGSPVADPPISAHLMYPEMSPYTDDDDGGDGDDGYEDETCRPAPLRRRLPVSPTDNHPPALRPGSMRPPPAVFDAHPPALRPGFAGMREPATLSSSWRDIR